MLTFSSNLVWPATQPMWRQMFRLGWPIKQWTAQRILIGQTFWIRPISNHALKFVFILVLFLNVTSVGSHFLLLTQPPEGIQKYRTGQFRVGGCRWFLLFSYLRWRSRFEKLLKTDLIKNGRFCRWTLNGWQRLPIKTDDYVYTKKKKVS